MLDELEGDVAIGHNRYSTTGASTWTNAQPCHRAVGGLQFALAHNGNLVNTAELASQAGVLDGTVTSDTDVIAELIAAELGAGAGSVTEALAKVLPRLEGAFSLVLATSEQVLAVRDPDGFWPLFLGEFDGGWAVASETTALDTIGASVEREIEPGETVVIDRNGPRSVAKGGKRARLCLFESVYFSRPDGRLDGQSVHASRRRMGEQLAAQAPVEADVVIPVPESGVPAAQGYAKASGIPYEDGFIKNRYIGRTFIAPDPELRSLGVRIKLNPLRENIDGKRLVVVDDSIVRGTTTKAMVDMLRATGEREIHLRISSPPYRWPCFYGMDTGLRSELLAADRSTAELRAHLGVDSLAYLELDRLIGATGSDADFCTACLTGDYPVPIPAAIGKDILEPS